VGLLFPSGAGSAVQYLPGQRFPPPASFLGLLKRLTEVKGGIKLEQTRALVRMMAAEYSNILLLGQMASFLASQTQLPSCEMRELTLHLEACLRKHVEMDHTGWDQVNGRDFDAIEAVKHFDALRPGFNKGRLQLVSSFMPSRTPGNR